MQDPNKGTQELHQLLVKLFTEADKSISHIDTIRKKGTDAIERAEAVVTPSITQRVIDQTKNLIYRLTERLVEINCDFELADDELPNLTISYLPVGNQLVQLQFLAGESPWNFWLCDKSVDIKSLHKTLLQKYQKGLLESYLNPKPSDPVCFFDRNRIFRGIILQAINGNRVKVVDCDSNLSKVVTTDRVFRPDPDACAVHASALRCTIIKETGGTELWNADLRDMFCNALKESTLHVKILEKLPGSFPNFLVNVEMHCEEEKGNLKEWLIERLLPELKKLNTDENESICDFLSAESLNPYYKSSFVEDAVTETQGVDRRDNVSRIPEVESPTKDNINNLNSDTNKFLIKILPNVDNHSEDVKPATPEANDQVSSSSDDVGVALSDDITSLYSKGSQSDANSISSGCEKEAVLDIRLDGASKEFKPKTTTQPQHQPAPRRQFPPRFKAHHAGYPPQVYQQPSYPAYPLLPVQHIPVSWGFEGPPLQHAPSWPQSPSFSPWLPPGNVPNMPQIITPAPQKNWSSGDEQYSNSNSDGNEENVKIENINNINVNVNVMAPEFVPRQSNDDKGYSEEQTANAQINKSRLSILPTPDTTMHIELRKPRTLIKPGENLLVMIAHVESPSEFYVHFLTSNNRLIDRLRNSMFQHYNTKKLMVYGSWREAKQALGKYCACKWEEDKHWYRVEVMDWMAGDNHVIVYFVDYGNRDCVSVSSLQALPQDFEKLPMCAQRCHLAQVHPLIKDKPWSLESIEFFKSKVDESNSRVYSITVVPSKNDNKVLSNSLSVLLFEGKATDDTSSINDLMVDEGLAWSKRLLTQPVLSEGSDNFQPLDELVLANGSAEKEAKPPQTLPLDLDLNAELNATTAAQKDGEWKKWDPRAEDYWSARNNPALDLDDACVAVTGYSAKDEMRVCKFFAEAGFCWKENCSMEHFKPNKDGVTTDKEEVYCRAFAEMSLPAPGEDINVRVTAVESLSCFYIQLRENEAMSSEAEEDEDEETMTSLHNFMNLPENLETMRFLAVPPALGQLVLAKYEGEWFRARVVSADDNPEVMFVDYGSIATINEVDLRLMEPRYLHLPFQAIECSLANIVPPEDSELYKRGTEQLKDLILGSILIAKVYDCSSGETFQRMDLFLRNSEGDIGQFLVEQGFATELPVTWQSFVPPKRVKYCPG